MDAWDSMDMIATALEAALWFAATMSLDHRDHSMGANTAGDINC
jgi:hypothetical protein